MSEVTVTEHLLRHQKRWSPAATGQFTNLLNNLVLSAKIISRSVNKAGLLDILGGTGEVNVQGEKVQKLDDFADDILHLRMERSGVVCAIASEERESVYLVPKDKQRGRYFLIFDPLDGSSNIDVNINVGTIFGIYRLSEDQAQDTKVEDLLKTGAEQVAAGYFLYGSSTMLVYSTGHGVNGFTLDPSVGEFLLSHENITIPSNGHYYSVNESNYPQWDDAAKKAVSWFKTLRGPKDENYSLRYVGSLVADFHRTLIYGGIFLYPQDKRKPEGKLRLMYEASPLAFLVEQAGGKATNGKERILDLVPKSVHSRTPLFIGSPKDVEIVEAAYAHTLTL